MAGRKKDNEDLLNLDDITSLLNTIDALVSTAGNTEEIAAKTVPIEKVKTEDLREEGFADVQLEEIEKGIAEGLPVDRYAKPEFNWMQMSEIRQGLESSLDTRVYESPLYSPSQMREIRLGLLDGLDVISYANLIFSATDMRKIRRVLFAQAYKQNPKAFGRTVKDDETGIQLRISDDCMKVFLKVPADFPDPITKECLQQVLENNEILYGIKQDVLEKIVAEQPLDQEICVAQGKPPIEGKPGRFELFFENSIEKGRTAPPDGDIDYTDVNIVELIAPGDTLIKYHPSQKDVNGTTVTGIPVDGVVGEELPILTGIGFRYDAEKYLYIATEKGYASYSDTTSCLNVWKTYKINGDLCYYQSLEYDGTVHVYGSLRSSAVIRAKGDIIIDGFLENASVYSDQNIVIKGGANGGSHGVIEAGGSVRGNFFENVDIKAHGLVEGNYFLNCNIVTDDRLVARGKKARIMGGDIVAAVGVEAVLIGNYMSRKTFFNVGDIYDIEKRIQTAEQEKEKIMEEFDSLTMGRQKLILLLGEEQAVGNALYEKTCKALLAAEQRLQKYDYEIARLHVVMRRAQKAYIRIHRELQADVILIINGVRKIAEETIHRSLYLTKESSQKTKQLSSHHKH